MGSIAPEDKARIDQLRILVKEDLSPYYDTPFNLLRWLQGHSTLSIEEVAHKLRHHLKLRKCWSLDDMGNKKRSHPIHSHWRQGITGPSGVEENCIVNIEQCGRTDYLGMMESFSIAEVMRARVPDLEEMLAECMKLEKETGKQAWIIYVMDVTGLEYTRKLYDLVTGSMRSLAEFMADHYVEMIKFFVPVNVPVFIPTLYAVVRPLLPERTKHKVRMCSSNWRSDILQYASANTLPSFWNIEDETFKANVDLPIVFPLEKYYSQQNLKTPSDAEVIHVSAGKHHEISMNLEKDTNLSLWVRGNRCFGFSVLMAKNEKDDNFEGMDQVFPTFPWMPGPTLVPLDETIRIPQTNNIIEAIRNENSSRITKNSLSLQSLKTAEYFA